MKKIISFICIISALACLSSCKDDNDSNPVLKQPESFVLNTPNFSINNVYDLPYSEYITLTTSQPDYGGFPVSVTYQVQVSLENDFEDIYSYTVLPTTFTSTTLQVPASEMDAAVKDLYADANYGAVPEKDQVLPVYIRLRAYLADATAAYQNECFSNSVSINARTYEAPVAAELPTELYVVGNSIQTAWNSWKPMAPVYGRDGRFYTLIYNNADGFKWGTKENDWRGYGHLAEIENNTSTTISEDGDGNIVFSDAGWYTLEFVATISGNDVNYKMIVSTGEAYVIGNAVDGGSWSGVAMTMPDNADGLWTFSDFTGSGELRAYINVPGEDWWRTEFTLYQGSLFWRTMDIPNNWAENVGEDYSVQVGVGNVLSINFNYNTGSVE